MTGTSVLPDRFEVRPRLLLTTTLMTLVCGAFTLAGAWLVSLDRFDRVLAGLLSIAFFGVGGFGAILYFIPKFARRKVSMVLTRSGIELRYVKGSTFLPWEDVEKIGVFKIGRTQAASFVGVRLRAYEHYTGNMTPELAKFSVTVLRILSFGKVKSISGGLEWSRMKYDYELTIGWADRDRPAEKFAALLEEYRAAA